MKIKGTTIPEYSKCVGAKAQDEKMRWNTTKTNNGRNFQYTKFSVIGSFPTDRRNRLGTRPKSACGKSSNCRFSFSTARNAITEVWTSCLLQHTPLLISDGLYQQLNYSLHLVTSSAFIGYGWGSRTFRNITADSIYILVRGWLSMTKLLLEHSWRSHYNYQSHWIRNFRFFFPYFGFLLPLKFGCHCL